MSAVSIYCSGEDKVGKTFGSPIISVGKPFFIFKMKPASELSEEYDNSKKNSLNGIVTSFILEKSESVTVTSTMGTDIFMYVGGETPWNIRISGYAFNNCDNDIHGFDTVTNWYSNENVTKTGEYCELIIGSQVFKGYLVYYKIASVNEDIFNLFRFDFNFIAVKTSF